MSYNLIDPRVYRLSMFISIMDSAILIITAMTGALWNGCALSAPPSGNPYHVFGCCGSTCSMDAIQPGVDFGAYSPQTPDTVRTLLGSRRHSFETVYLNNKVRESNVISDFLIGPPNNTPQPQHRKLHSQSQCPGQPRQAPRQRA